MKFSEPENQDESVIEMTPLIDVVFLLLIFFMVTTTFSKESSLKINLPESAENSKSDNLPAMLEIYVTEGAGYALRGPGDKAPKSLVNGKRDTLVLAMQPFSGSKEGSDSKEMPLVVIRADKLATHEAVVQVMDVAQQLGLNRITFATEKTAKK